MKASHSAGVASAVPHTSSVPTPNMTPLEIAFRKGQEAKHRGSAENPHTDKLATSQSEGQLAKEWDRGYGS